MQQVKRTVRMSSWRRSAQAEGACEISSAHWELEAVGGIVVLPALSLLRALPWAGGDAMGSVWPIE